MSLKSTPQVLKHLTSPTLCRRQKSAPSTGSISRNPLMCPPKKNGSFPECGGGRFLCSENEVVLNVVPKPSPLLKQGLGASLTRLGRNSSPSIRKKPSQYKSPFYNVSKERCLIAYEDQIDHWEFRRCRKEQKLKFPTLVLFPFFLSAVPGSDLDSWTFSATVLSPLS